MFYPVKRSIIIIIGIVQKLQKKQAQILVSIILCTITVLHKQYLGMQRHTSDNNYYCVCYNIYQVHAHLARCFLFKSLNNNIA